MSPNSNTTPRKPITSNFQKGSRFLLWPDRTRAELERLCITTEEIAPIPPHWRRITPTQYLEERPKNVHVLDASGQIMQLVPATQQFSDMTLSTVLCRNVLLKDRKQR